MNDPADVLPVLVAGGGIGGPTAALGLMRRDFGGPQCVEFGRDRLAPAEMGDCGRSRADRLRGCRGPGPAARPDALPAAALPAWRRVDADRALAEQLAPDLFRVADAPIGAALNVLHAQRPQPAR
ncbi:MAG: hypothetical protein HYZ20_14325 [Burkholderiales bacterium]|nr:hypothetical protein [Burkholderiales bacterium]